MSISQRHTIRVVVLVQRPAIERRELGYPLHLKEWHAVRGTVVLLPTPGGRPAVQSRAWAGVATVVVMVVDEREVVWPEA
jgi:hypothetical protein